MRKLYFATLFFLHLFSFQLFANEIHAIAVDNKGHSLVAPEGKYHQWFLNGKIIQGATAQNLEVKESGNYAVNIVNADGLVLAEQVQVICTAAGTIIKIYIIGDSTVCNYKASDYPWTGWGQILPSFFTTGSASITNNAIGGRSSRTFYQEGRWTPIKDALQPGDYVFIQFGHNDRDTNPDRYTSVSDYKNYLTIYCNDALAKGAVPVLVSPMVMNAWTGSTMRNVFTETGNNYRGAMQEVATALNVPFVDLNMKSWNLYKTFGQAYLTRFIYKGLVAGEYPNYPTGVTDGTHFQEMGSIGQCVMITQGITELSSRADMTKLVQNLKPLYPVSVAVNPLGADDLTTKSGNYPQGVTITLKTLPKTGSIFKQWNNAGGKSIATTTLTTFTSGSAASSYTALYNGAITAVEDEMSVPAIAVYPNPFVAGFQLVAAGEFSYTILDLTGRMVESGSGSDKAEAGDKLQPGIYFIRVQREGISKVFQVEKR